MRSTLSHTDAYKLSHKSFMDARTEYIYSNGTPRSNKHLPVLKEFFDDKTTLFSLQYLIKDYLIKEWNETFFLQPKDKVIAQFKRRCDTFLGPDSVDMTHFEELHDLGYLPILIKALPEGTQVPSKVPYFTIVNTNPKFAWLTNYLETIISCEIYKPCVSATIARSFRKLINHFAMKTVGNLNGTEFQGHGFEFRGMSGRHDAAITGSGHLLSFCGTDTIPAIDLLEDYYNADATKELIASSVPASEHMVTSLGIVTITEREFYRRAITKAYPTGIVSLVADTQDFFKVITEDALALKNDILNRKPNALGLAKVVFRPDSGNPVRIIGGYKYKKVENACSENCYLANKEGYEILVLNNGNFFSLDPTFPNSCYKINITMPEVKGAVECLWDIFGGTITEKGYKLLHERAGLIYGDSITQQIAFDMFTLLESKGFASTNTVLGIGSYTYNYVTRDSIGFAIKGTWAQVGGVAFELSKEPKTDGETGCKKSAKGLLRVDLVDGEYKLKDQCTPEEEAGGELKPVFLDGALLVDWKLSEIRARVAANL